jgi:hypothetical protein
MPSHTCLRFASTASVVNAAGISFSTYISDALYFLPNGIIDKRNTGMGATHSELFSERNSIIVEPLKAIVIDKLNSCRGLADNDKFDFFYIGSDFDNDYRKPTDSEIEIASKSKKYKKFVVVADSFWRLVKLVPNIFQEYFLMIDEIDQFQTESDYRPALEKVIDHYFKFKDRCVISSTIREFSHPEFKTEPMWIFNYKKNLETKLDLKITTNINRSLANFIVSNKNKKEKILVAYNSIQNILETIELLDKYSRDEVGV